MSYGADMYDPMVPASSYVPQLLDDDTGIYLLDDERTVGRDTKIYDPCTRVLYDDAHPRAYPGGQRYPGPMGAGRATDQVGPTLEERRADARRYPAGYTLARPPVPGPIPTRLPAYASGRPERFTCRPGVPTGPPSGPALAPVPENMRELDAAALAGRGCGAACAASAAAYGSGDARVGAPGYRGLTSARWERPVYEAADWDPRPPHFIADTPNAYAHGKITRGEQGPDLFPYDPVYPGFRPVDKFAGGPARPPCGCGGAEWDTATLASVVLLFVLMVVCAMLLGVRCGENRMRERIHLAAALRSPGLAAFE
jgi:hypothetical protein